MPSTPVPPESVPGSQVSRRLMLRTCGLSVAALAAAPVAIAGARARVRPAALRSARPRTAGALRRTLPATAGAGLHGATLSPAAFGAGTTWPQAIADWEGDTATTITAAKVYYAPGVFPTSVDPEIQAYIDHGTKALLSFKPAFRPPSKTDRANLASALAMFGQAGLTATVTLWQEAQQVMTASQYNNVVHYYSDTIRQYYPLAYDVSGGVSPSGWTKYYPGDVYFDVVAVDYYATAYLKGTLLDVIAGIADGAKQPMPFGIWEMGDSSTKTNSPPTQSQMDSYFGYVSSFMSSRLQAGKTNAEILWYNGTGLNAITASSDFRALLWESLVSATS